MRGADFARVARSPPRRRRWVAHLYAPYAPPPGVAPIAAGKLTEHAPSPGPSRPPKTRPSRRSPSAALAGPKIAKLARSINLPGCRIRVREQSGATIILVGVAVAMRYADFNFGA